MANPRESSTPLTAGEEASVEQKTYLAILAYHYVRQLLNRTTALAVLRSCMTSTCDHWQQWQL